MSRISILTSLNLLILVFQINFEIYECIILYIVFYFLDSLA